MNRFLLFFLIFFCVTVDAKEIELTLNKAIDLALKNNSLKKISKLNLEIAKAQYQQALGANYPTLDLILHAKRNNSDLVYQQRGTFTLSSDIVTMMNQLLAKNAVAGSIPSALDSNVDTVAYGRDTVTTSLNMNYALYAGGKVSSIIKQAQLNKIIKQEAITRDENSVVFDVKKYFYAYMLTNNLYSLLDDTYETMKFSRDLTKEFMENGTSLKIKKTDYLGIKLLTTLLETTLYKIDMNRQMLKGALGALVGLEYDDTVNIKYKNSEILKQNLSLQNLIDSAKQFNPDMKSMDLVLKIKDEQVKEANSGYKPIVNVFGSVWHYYNSYEYGYLNKDDSNRWSLGVLVKMNLFNGFTTQNSVLEKKLDRKLADEQRVLLKKSLALQLKNEFIKSSIGYKELKTLEEAVEIAKENSDMNFKGYKYEMVEARDLVQSEMLELYVKVDYLKSLHDYLLSLATIDKLVGKEIEKSN